MPRQRSMPWTYRWSRPIMAGIAAIGAAVTAYLTYSKLTGNKAACPTNGCDVVLASPYATVLGQPLALFGFLAYASMVIFAIAPLLLNSPNRKDLRAKLENWTGLLLLLGAAAMMTFSGYLMYLLAFNIKAVCLYCVASAIFSATLFILALIGREWKDLGLPIFGTAIVAVLVLLTTLGVYAPINSPTAKDPGNGQPSPGGFTITTTSGPAEIALAKHLTQTKATFYGAYWCPHCHDQKQLFGKEAVKSIPYVECIEGGINPQPKSCEAAGVKSFPTWAVNGKTVTGTRPLQELAQLSGYKGPQNFKNELPDKPDAH
jgi:uncharacterized membrane protein/glutaredoxin